VIVYFAIFGEFSADFRF